MRFLVKVTIPVEAGNKMIAGGKLAETMQKILSDLKPEATYFALSNGQRTVYLFVNAEKTSDVPAIGEPLWLALNADVEMAPAMTLEDLMAAGPAIEAAAKKYAS